MNVVQLVSVSSSLPELLEGTSVTMVTSGLVVRCFGGGGGSSGMTTDVGKRGTGATASDEGGVKGDFESGSSV